MGMFFKKSALTLLCDRKALELILSVTAESTRAEIKALVHDLSN